jgi:DNA gyrase/topoisomerase IV subunit B
MIAKTAYDASSITWLRGLEGVRKKLSVYIGEADTRGVTHLFKEIMGNAVDEAVNGHGKTVGLKINKNTVTVFDNGRGIPTGKHPKYKNVDTLTILATELHAGGKLDAGAGNYTTSAGTNGMGLSIVNALSKDLTIWSINPATHTGVKKQSFKKGIPVSEVLSCSFSDVPTLNGKPWFKKGTVVEYSWDETVFDKGAKLDAKDIMSYLRDISFFNFQFNSKQKTPLTFMCEINGKEINITRKSILGYIKYATTRLALKKEPVFVENSTFGAYGDTVDLVLSWTDLPDTRFYCAANSLPTSQGGTHLKGALNAIEAAFKFYHKKSEFRQQDLMMGVIGCVNVRVASPRFDSQSKNKLTSPEQTKIAYDAVYDLITKWIRANKDTAKIIVDRAVEISKMLGDDKFSKQLAKILQTKKNGKNMLPAGMVTCSAKNPMDREISLVEGTSAGGTARSASDRSYQEILPLRGKILNVMKADQDKMTGSSAIISLLQAIGYDPKNPTGNLRVGKINLLSDSDEDGHHINALVLSVIYKTVPHLFDEGRVFVVDAPLFVYSTPKSKIFGSTLNELKQKIGKSFDTKYVSRLKGYGEANPDELREIAFNPATRKLIKIDAPTAKSAVMDAMGSDTSVRKELLGL